MVWRSKVLAGWHARGFFFLGRRCPLVVVGGMTGALLLAARPKTLPAAIVPVWAGCVLAWKSTGRFDAMLAACTVLGAICIQIATNFFNDAIDARKGADTAARLGPVRVTASGRMSRRAVMIWGVLFLIGAVACGVPLFQARGWPILVIGVPSLFLAYGYTGGPWPLAYRGMGELFVVLFFGLVAVMGTVFLQTGTWPASGALLGLQIGLLSAVLISINNLRDRQEDATTGKRTLAVRLGPKVALAVIFGEILGAALAGAIWLPLGMAPLAIASVPVLLIGGFLGWQLAVTPPGPVYNKLLALAGLQLILFAAVFHLAAR
jgi:1,4-dihydroxy-2-naphthoate octaprenyltransferase